MAIVRIGKGVTDLTGLIADTNEVHFVEGSQTVNAGLNQSALTEGSARVVVARTFTGNIGGSGGALRMDVDSGNGIFEYNAGGGSCWYQPNGDDNLCKDMRLTGAGSMYLVNGGTVTELGIAKGYLSVADSVVVTNLRASGGSTVVGYSATAITELHAGGGQIISQRSCTTGVFNNVAAVFKREDTSGTVGTATTIRIGNARVKWCLGNITTVELNHPDAFIDLSEAPADLTITTLKGFGQAIAKSLTKSKLATVTISTTTPYIGDADFWKDYGVGGGAGFGLTP